MPKKLFICAHGVGDHKENFHEAWADVLHRNHGVDRFKVTGLFWDDIQDELYDKFFTLPGDLQQLAENTFLKNVYEFLNDPAHAALVEFLKEYAFDAASYLLLREFRNATLWPKCIVRLQEAIDAHPGYQPVLIGHSLGSVMVTHITWYIRHHTGSLNVDDCILIGSPLGLKSPTGLIPDFLSLLAEVGNHANRMDALSAWAGEWYHPVKNRLHILINEHDPVASDVKIKMTISGVDIQQDLLPVRQGLSDEEITRIEETNPGTVQKFRSGGNTPADLLSNHDALKYLDSALFQATFEEILND